MAAIYPPQHVDAPPAGPLRYGLFNVVQRAPWQDIMGVAGVQFEPDTCGVARLYTAECPPSNQNAKTFDTNNATVTGAPFWAYSGVVCAPVGRPISEQEQRAQRALISGEQTQVEAALWNGGGVGASPALTLAGATIVATATTTFGARLAALEEAFYSAYGYQGTIHVNTAAYGAAAFGNLIVRPDSPVMAAQLGTPLGSLWSFGAGYDITGPANAAPAAGSVWAFMTGAVSMWQGDIKVPPGEQTFNRIMNQAYVEAARPYVVAPDCPQIFAIQLPLEAP
jgi:hypothetical protein